MQLSNLLTSQQQTEPLNGLQQSRILKVSIFEGSIDVSFTACGIFHTHVCTDVRNITF